MIYRKGPGTVEYQWTKQDGAYQESDVPAGQNCRINIMTEEEFQALEGKWGK